MGLTGLLALLVVALFGVTVKFFLDGVREKNRKKAILSAVAFCGVVAVLYVGLLWLITSM